MHEKHLRRHVHTLYRLGWKSGIDLRGIASTKLIMTSYYHIKVPRLEKDPFVVCVCVT